MAQEDLNQDVVLINQDGQQERFTHLLTFLHEGERYVALTPEAEGEAAQAEAEEAEVVLLKVESKGGEDTYVTIDNSVMLDEVFGVFLDLMEEREEDEEENS